MLIAARSKTTSVMNSSKSPTKDHAAFTLVEVLVSTVLIVLLMGLLLSTVSQSQNVMSRTTAKVKQFQAARTAFDSMTRRLSQATLTTYYRAFDSDATDENATFTFTRESSLQFLSGPTAPASNGAPGVFAAPAIPNLNQPVAACYPTHSVFFQAPLGFTTEKDPLVTKESVPRFRDVDQALVGVGYFIEYGPDPDIPGFLRTLNYPDRKRFRLMELNVPTERLPIYRRPLDVPADEKRKYRNDPQILDRNQLDYTGLIDANRAIVKSWIRPLWLLDKDDKGGPLVRAAVTGSTSAYRFTYAQSMADNVFALVILPKLAARDRKKLNGLDDLAPNYSFDSWRILKKDTPHPQLAARDNQLPPILQVTMIVMDEPSAIRMQEKYPDKPTEWTKDLFTTVTTVDKYLDDVAKVEKAIKDEVVPINYRIFTTDVVIRGSKWTPDY